MSALRRRLRRKMPKERKARPVRAMSKKDWALPPP
jgi:hypothetical protein